MSNSTNLETASVTQDLRKQIFSGGAYLAVRQVVGIFLSACGVIAITRLIGPTQYGAYISAWGIYSFVQNLGHVGIGVYLIRQEGVPEEEDYWVASTMLLCLSLFALSVLQLVVPLIGAWIRIAGFAPLLRVLALSLPLQLVNIPAMAKLEKALDYRKVAGIELAGQSVMYGISIPLAFAGYGAWALVIGSCGQQLLQFVLAHYLTSYFPRLHLDKRRCRSMSSYSLSYSTSIWIWQARSLVNPLIVARFLGADAAGYVGISIRLVELLTFIKSVTWRIAISALARVQHERHRLLNAVSEGMRLQVLATAPPLIAFSWAGVLLLPKLFGARWEPVAVVFPFIAASYLINAIFNLHSSTLYVLKNNLDVSLFHICHIFLFALSARLLVVRLGLVGYGWAEIIAFASYAIIHWRVAKIVGTLRYGIVPVWAAAAVLSLFWRQLGLWTFLGLGVALVWPGTLRQFRDYTKSIRGSMQHA